MSTWAAIFARRRFRDLHRWSAPVSDDDRGVSRQRRPDEGGPATLLELYDSALPEVYGYLLHRCGRQDLAEDLTAETFLAAVDAVRRPDAPVLGVPWIIGVARHKLVDHWRRQARAERDLAAVGRELPDRVDPWDARLDVVVALGVLDRLGPLHRMVLTLRYLDDLPVPEVARIIGRSTHATEALLVRARAAFRRAYCARGRDDA
jgi:RNA polymerase sigma-70 factor (ECF subfamily)